MPKNWVINEKKAPSKELVEAAGSEVIAGLLFQRGVNTPEKIKKFLNPLDIEPVSPYAFADMEKAVSRIKEAIDSQQHIVICGDFDADGVTSTAVLHKTLNYLGANFSYYIPDRKTESHGLSSAVLLKKLAKEKAKLFITVDCAICDVEEVALVNSFGGQVIITDHHESKDVLPDAYAIIDAKAQGALIDDLSIEQINSLTAMAGVGVAFKLACALLDEYGKIDFTQELLPLVALGTVADIMPLLYENRLFVTLGMQLISEGKNPGLSALLRSAGVKADEEITSDKLAFTLAPRINAAGRLDSADIAFSLLTTDNPAELAIYAQTLSDYNKIRQELGDKIYLEALEYIEQNGNENDSVVVAYNPEWHIGIIGIVASRLVEKFNKPAFMFTDAADGERYRASVRSVESVNIFDALEINSDIIASYGGHSMAAGLALKKNETSIDEFKEAINSTIFEMTGGVIVPPSLEIDMEIEVKDLNFDLLGDLKKLEPCGVGNKLPVFAIKNLYLESEKVMGQESNHLKFVCRDKDFSTIDCVFWNHSSLNIPCGKQLDIAFYPKINDFNGVRSVQLDIQDYNSEFISSSNSSNIKVIDHRKKVGILPQVADYIKSSAKSFKIFIEDKEIANKISAFDEIAENVITRLNAVNADQLMFFDYPADEKLLKFLLRAVKPRVVHFMEYRTPVADIDVLISKVSGMLKYASSKYDGVVYLPDISTALSITDELTTLIIKLLNRTGVVKVTDFERGKVHFDFLGSISIDKIKLHEVYEQCRIELFKSKNYRDSLVATTDLSKFVN